MSNTNLPESLETLVKQIKQNLYKVISRISTMLDAARIEDSKDDFSPVQNDVVAYIYSILQQFNSAFNSHDIALQISLPEQAINMSYDPQKLERIIANLLSNAIKHNPNKRQVFFNVTQENETLLIKIKDLGQGIAKEKQKRIFHKFERGSTFKPGSGLGLSIVKQYVNLHRGKISINSEENKFTEFIINLPLNRQTKKTENIILANNDLYFTRQMANSFNHTSIKQPSHVIYLSEKPNTDIEQLFQDKLIIITNVTEVLQLDKPKIIIFDSNRSFSEIKDSVKTIKEKHPIAFLFIVVPFFEKNKISSLLKLGANEVFTEPDYLDELVLKLAFYFQLENYQNKIYR